MLLAVESIPAYIARSDFFLVLAPTLRHNDKKEIICSKGSWQDRGWCRFEQSMYALLQRKGIEDTSAIFIHHTGFIQEAVPMQWLFCLPQDGIFSVESDRSTVDQMVALVAAERLDRLYNTSQFFDWRFFQAVYRYIDRSSKVEEDFTQWMKNYGFGTTADVGIPDCWGPALFAAVEGNEKILRRLFEMSCPIDQPALGAPLSIMAGPGMTPLMAAAALIPNKDVCLETCKVLLSLKASTDAKDGAGQTVLHYAAGAPCGAGILKYLLDSKIDPNLKDDGGEVPLHKSSLTNATANVSRTENIGLLLNAGAKWDIRGGPFMGSPWLFMGSCCYDEVKMYLDAGADPNEQLQPSPEFDAARTGSPASQKESVVGVVLEHGEGMTTMMLAAWVGSWETVELILERKGDPNLKTAGGRRAIDWLIDYGVTWGPTYEVLEKVTKK